MRPFLLLALAACAAPAAPEWRPLFNGVDLTGWEPVNVAPGTFSVRDGLLVCSGHPTGVLRTDRMYENFVLELEYRHLQPGGNAGLFVWSDPLPARGVPFTRSLEVQIMDGVETADYTSHGDIFSIWGARFVPERPHPSGWERCLPSEKRAHPAPEWNHYRVTCRDGAIELEVNGVQVSGGSDASPRRGYLCLESEGSEVHFRNLRLLELPPAEPPLPSALVARQARGLAPAFDGLTLEGFRAPGGGAPDAAHWTVADGILATDGAGGDLDGPPLGETFEVLLDWRQPAGAPARVPLQLPCELPEVPEAATEGWHRLLLRHEAAWQGRPASVWLIVDERRSLQVLDPEAQQPARQAPGLRLHPEGRPVEYRNLFVRDG